MNSKADKSAIIGIAKFFDVEVDSTPGAEQILLDETVASGKTCRVLTLFFKSVFPAKWKATSNADLIASGFTGPGYPKDIHFWVAGQDTLAGEKLKITAEVASNNIVDKIGVHIEARIF